MRKLVWGSCKIMQRKTGLAFRSGAIKGGGWSVKVKGRPRARGRRGEEGGGEWVMMSADGGGLDGRRGRGMSGALLFTFILTWGVVDGFIEGFICFAKLGIVPSSGGNFLFRAFPKMSFESTCCVHKILAKVVLLWGWIREMKVNQCYTWVLCGAHAFRDSRKGNLWENVSRIRRWCPDSWGTPGCLIFWCKIDVGLDQCVLSAAEREVMIVCGPAPK